MEKPTVDQFLQSVINVQTQNPHMRLGQCYMTSLRYWNPSLYAQVEGTEADCFNIDGRIARLVNFVRANW